MSNGSDNKPKITVPLRVKTELVFASDMIEESGAVPVQVPVPAPPPSPAPEEEQKTEKLTYLQFKTHYSVTEDIENIFGRMHFSNYDQYLYPFETGILQFWKALDWRAIEFTETTKVGTGKFQKKEISGELLKQVSETSWSRTTVKGLTRTISDQLSKAILDGQGRLETDEDGGDTNVERITQKIEKEILAVIQAHTKNLHTRGTEIMRDEITNKSRLEVEFENFVVTCDDPETVALLLGMKECVLATKERVETLRKWRAKGVPEDERDYTFVWERPPTESGENKGKEFQAPDGWKGPFDHQWTMYKTHTLLSESADLSEMGTGKTLSCLMAIDKRIQRGEVRRGHVLVVAPTTTLELSWQKQIGKFTPHLSSSIVTGNYVERMTTFMKPAATRGDILLINYESFAMDTKLPGHDGAERIIPLSQVCGLVEWDMVVLDECHKIKNPEAKRTGLLIDAFKSAKHKLIMSGTINANKLHDIHVPFVHLNKAVQFNSVHRHRNGKEMSLGDLHGEFKSGYFNTYGRAFVPKSGAIAELREKLEEVSVRFEKKECLTLPDKVYMSEELEMSAKQRQLYNLLRNTIIADLNDIHERGGRVTTQHILAKLTKLAEAANGWLYNDRHEVIELPWNPKLDRLKELVSDIDLDTQKVVVWSRFTHDLHLIAKAMREEYGEEAVVVVHGGGHCSSCGSDKAKRKEHVEKFLDMSPGNKVKVAVLNQQTGSHGIDLTSCTYEFFYSNSFSKTDRLQAEDRGHRQGMRESLTIVDLICKGTVDEQVMEALTTHKTMTTALLGALGLDLDFDLDREGEEKVEEPPVIKIQKQGEEECLLASCAMIAGKTIEEGRKVAQGLGIVPWRGTHLNMFRVLETWGVKLKQVWGIAGEKRAGITIVKWASGTSHAIAFHGEKVYDPMYNEAKPLREWLALVIERGGKVAKTWVVDVAPTQAPIPAAPPKLEATEAVN